MMLINSFYSSLPQITVSEKYLLGNAVEQTHRAFLQDAKC